MTWKEVATHRRCCPALAAQIDTEAVKCDGLQFADLCAAYLSCDDTLVKVVLTWVPRAVTTATMAMEMPAAIRPYSIAVAPD
jgi:hypothetical protein